MFTAALFTIGRIWKPSEALSVAKPNGQPVGLGVPWPFADLPQAEYWWQPALLHSLTQPTCNQTQQSQLIIVEHFVSLNK